jgi:hypothetical protein
MKDITNINVTVTESYPYSKRASASWEAEGARFHVWFDVGTMELDRDSHRDGTKLIVYKNSTVSHKEPGYFKTRYLDGDKPGNAAIIRHVFGVIESSGLIAKAIAWVEDEQRRRDAEHKVAVRQERIKEAGLALFDALALIRDSDSFAGGTSVKELQGIARDALKKAEAE